MFQKLAQKMIREVMAQNDVNKTDVNDHIGGGGGGRVVKALGLWLCDGYHAGSNPRRS